jgi:hypothetical protein
MSTVLPHPVPSGVVLPRSVLATSWWLVRRPPLLVPVAVAVLLTVTLLSVMDLDYHGLRLMRGVGLLLACAWVAVMDDPAGEVVAASPYPRTVRTGARILAGGAVVVPAWAGCAVAVEVVMPSTPVLALGVEALALATLGLGIGAGLRAWRDVHLAAHLATLGLVAAALLTNALPRWYAMIQGQTWGPPWEAAQIRWWALLLLALGVLGLALRDPLARPGRSVRSGVTGVERTPDEAAVLVGRADAVGAVVRAGSPR